MLVKQYIRTNIRAIVVAMGVLVLVFGFASQALAQAADQTNSANVLKVSPVRTDIEIQPGESQVVQATVTNLTDDAITVRPIANDFIAGDEHGTPALILDEDKFAPTHSLKRFMGPLENVVIPAKQAKTIGVEITVPADAQAGGYFGAVRFAPVASDGGGQVNLSASAASLILLTVPGDIVEKLELTDFSIRQDGKSAPYFMTAGNLEALVRFENKGNIQIGPFGRVSVKKGNEVVYEGNLNDKTPRDMILPDSARRWEVPLQDVEGFGRYTVSATFTYGQKNQTIELTRSFWVIPLVVIIAAIVALLALIGLIVGIWLYARNRKRRNLRGGFGGNARFRR